MARTKRWWAVVAASVMAVVLCTACSPSSGKREDADASAVVSAVEAADARVVSATAEQGVSGFSFGWIVEVVVSGDDPVTSDELSALLLGARHAGSREPGHVDLFVKSQAGASLDLTAAADQLGIRYSRIGDGIDVNSDAIDDTLGTGP